MSAFFNYFLVVLSSRSLSFRYGLGSFIYPSFLGCHVPTNFYLCLKGIQNFPHPLGPSVLAGTRLFSLIDVGPPPNPPPSWLTMLGKGFHSTPFRAQCSCWHSFIFSNRCGTTAKSTPPPSWLTLLGKGFHFTLFRAQCSCWHSFIFSKRYGTTTKSTPLQGPASLLAHRLVSTFLQGRASSLAHRPKPNSNIICNVPDPPLTDIVLFGLSLSSFPSRL